MEKKLQRSGQNDYLTKYESWISNIPPCHSSGDSLAIFFDIRGGIGGGGEVDARASKFAES